MSKDKKQQSKRSTIAKIVGSVLAAILVIVAVFVVIKGNEEQVVTYKYEEDGMTTSMTYYAKGDRVYKQTTESFIPYSSLGVETEAEAREMVGDLLSAAEGIKGYSDVVEYKEDHMTETVVVDYSVVNIDEIKNLPGNTFSDGDTSNGVSLSKSIKLLEDAGFKKVDK